ncbi:MAG: TIGR00296 family protein [Candidatus Woesearchaeota archaeon]
MKLTLAKANKLIKLARESISAVFDGKKFKISKEILDEFKEKRGVFVSLYVGKELMGCIGFPEPFKSLAEGIVLAAKGAAFEDPRFAPIEKKHMKKLRIEISVLTKPEEIKVKKWEDYPSKVKIGVDGLVIRDKFGAGLLLPQVAVEWGWDSKEFLDNTCKKSGLSPNCWCNLKRNVYKFQAQVFSEQNGKVIEKKLKA